MAQPHPFGVDPERAPGLTIDSRHAHAGIPPAGQGGDQRFEAFASGEFPGARPRKHLPIAQLLDKAHVGPRCRGGVRDDDDLLAPRWGPELAQHVPEQGVFGLRGAIVLASEQRTIDRGCDRRPTGPSGVQCDSRRRMDASD
jgi:hypothetical protein